MVSSFEEVPARDRVIVALDCGIEEAFDLADQLQGKATWMKVGMTLFYANGPAIVYALKERGFKVFLDLKFHDIPHSVEAVVSRCRAATKRPLIVKLTPNVTDVTEIARAAVSAGADALSLINTLLGMAIDAERRRPQLARGVGGLSGPAVKPVALRMVWEVHQAVDVPLLGMGGISCATDAVEFMLAGATAVAVGTANFVNPHATVEIIDGMAQYCERHGIEDVQQLIGALEW